MSLVAKRKAKSDEPAPPPNPWPARLKAVRDRYGLTQAQAAERIRISQSQWSAFESGGRQPTRPVAHLLELLIAGKI